MVEIAILTHDDWPLWRSLRLRALAEAPYAFSSTFAEWSGPLDEEARWRRRLNPPSHNLIAYLDSQPVGMASGMPSATDGNSLTIEMISLWVAPTARGRGIGDALVEAIIKWGAQRRVHSLTLSVFKSNFAAITLYRRHGFEEATDLGSRDQPPPSEIRMIRPLAASTP